MDLYFSHHKLHLPLEIIRYICSLIDQVSDICAARLVNRAFSAAATPFITDIWDSPSILFRRPDAATSTCISDSTSIDPENRSRWVKKPLTIWTWLNVPSQVLLEDEYGDIGKQFVDVILAPDVAWDDTYERLAFHRFGRKAVSWGRINQFSSSFCIVTQWDCRASLEQYRVSEEAEALREFLDRVCPGCTSSSSSEHMPIAPEPMRHRPLFEGYYEIRTIYFDPGMTHQQRLEFEKTDHLYRGRTMRRAQHHLGHSPWWWLRGLRTYGNGLAVAARFAFFWKTSQVEQDHQARQTRFEAQGSDASQSERRVVEIFEEELGAAGMIGTESFHCDFVHGTWRN